MALVAVALAVAIGVWLLATRLTPPSDLRPLAPAPRELSRGPVGSPMPEPTDPHQALRELQGQAALAPGDAALRDELQAALAAGEAPTYRVVVDVPFGDAAGQRVADGLRAWLTRKMAGVGFREATGKPTVVLALRVDPAATGRYRLQAVLRASGQPRYEGSFELPAASENDRMDTTMAPGFAAPWAAPAAGRSAP